MGGRDTPAAGFALYMDRLMQVIKTEDIEETITNRVLLSITPEAIKEGFEMAAMIREAGMTVEVALEGQQEIECGWLVETRAESPVFIVTNRVDGSKSAVDSAGNVLALLRCK